MDPDERLGADVRRKRQTRPSASEMLAQSLNETPRWNKHQRCEIFATFAVLVILLNGLNYWQPNLLCVRADDSAAAPPFDMGALASLATNLGSNTQIMSIVSNLLNPGGQQQKPAVGSAGGSQSDLGGAGGDVDSNSIDRQGAGGGPSEPLRRGMRTSLDQQPAQEVTATASASASISQQSPQQPPPPQAAQASQTTDAPAGPPTSGPSAPANPLGGLMSMLPSLLSSFSGGGGGSGGSGGSLNLGALSGLLGLNRPAPTPAPAASEPASGGAAAASASPPAAPPATKPPAGAATAAPASAQQVINQVLTAYASGQIPNDLIQLGLSGRVPPQIIELALSGQVPMDMIKMVITGQVPMTTINTFLSAIQQAPAPAPAAAAASNGGAAAAASKPAASSSPGVFATTRSLFETLLGLARSRGDSSRAESGKAGGITVPTLIGPIPLKIPNVRTIGQLVGGTITNFSSMIPF